MSEVTPTRSALAERKEDRRSMQEGYRFLDEKSALLAGEILRQLQAYKTLATELDGARVRALEALAAAVTRHGLEALQVYPSGSLEQVELAVTSASLMGVPVQAVRWSGPDAPAQAPVDPSPQAEECRVAFVDFIRAAALLAAVSGNLRRLDAEYRRTSHRARALNDVLLPELERQIGELEMRLEELEQEDAIWMRQGKRDRKWR
jgi:V/A-type H+-transporting ATPase subunit D